MVKSLYYGICGEDSRACRPSIVSLNHYSGLWGHRDVPSCVACGPGVIRADG
jgi:hypothetical protein